jgi:hypothetical protein
MTNEGYYMKQKKYEGKKFTIRLPKDLWVWLKHKSVEQEESMQEIIVRRVQKYKNKFEKCLTDNDTNV